jgi:hypothetical protein
VKRPDELKLRGAEKAGIFVLGEVHLFNPWLHKSILLRKSVILALHKLLAFYEARDSTKVSQD